MIKIWAHRGASAYAPENTLPAFALAAEMKADGVELDVHLSKDEKLIVSHDNTINRRSNGEGDINNMTLSELRSYKYGKNFEKYADADIPTLDQVYDLLKSTCAGFVNVEVKGGEGRIEPMLIALAKEKGMSDKIIYSSFSMKILQNLKNLDETVDIALLYGTSVEGVTDYAEYAVKMRLTALHPHFDAVIGNSTLVADCRAVGVEVNPWTVNDEENMKKCYEKGIYAIITNYPDTARRVLEEMA